jgi:hypothetical protein
VLRPAGRVTDADAGRLAARLRKREAALITLGDWPGSEASLRIVRSEWEGIGSGTGILRGRRVEVAVESRGRTRSRWIRLTGPDAGARVEETAPSSAAPAPAPVLPMYPVAVPAMHRADLPGAALTSPGLSGPALSGPALTADLPGTDFPEDRLAGDDLRDDELAEARAV